MNENWNNKKFYNSKWSTTDMSGDTQHDNTDFILPSI
jgi:hypothetical protein